MRDEADLHAIRWLRFVRKGIMLCRRMTRYFFAFVFLVLALSVNAQDYQKGAEAYDRRDYDEALQQWRPLAELGVAEAQSSLAHLYVFGLGVQEDYAEAAKWYREAAAQGYAEAQFNFGIMYDLGAGVPQDNVRAYMWTGLAAAGGYRRADEALARMSDAFSSSEVIEAKERIGDWSPGSDSAETERGWAAFEAGDTATALQAWRPLANEGEPNMQSNVANLLNSAGEVEAALELWSKAAEKGNRQAQYSIGTLYSQGRGVEQSYSQAATWWRKAATRCNVPAQYNLGLLYYYGDGVQRDMEKAYIWFTRAASGYQKSIDDGFDMTSPHKDAVGMGKKAYRRLSGSQKDKAMRFQDDLCEG